MEMKLGISMQWYDKLYIFYLFFFSESQSTVHRNHDELQISLNTASVYVYWSHACNRFDYDYSMQPQHNSNTKTDWRLWFVSLCVVFCFDSFCCYRYCATVAAYKCSVLLTISFSRIAFMLLCVVAFVLLLLLCFECHLINENPLISS